MQTLLFLCTGNSCRSQMAEGWARDLKGDQFIVYSAGIETHGLNPHAVQVMRESGVDISSHTSTLLDAYEDIKFDWVITVCGHAHETCPIFPVGAKVVHRGFPDPPALARGIEAEGGDEEAQLDAYRRVRDEIKHYVQTLPESLSVVS